MLVYVDDVLQVKMTTRRGRSRDRESDNPAFQMEVFEPLKPEHCHYVKGFSALFLGKVPTYDPSGPGCTDYCVEKLLDSYNIDETRAHEVYLDIKNIALLMYYVNEDGRVLHTKAFDLARISFCCGDHVQQPRIFSWVYKQETDVGFQLECYAVRCSSERKPRKLAQSLYKACQGLYVEIQEAFKSSQAFSKACEMRTDQQDSDADCDPGEEESVVPHSLGGARPKERSSGSLTFGYHPYLGDECIDLDLDDDSVFGSPESTSLSLDLYLGGDNN